MKLSRRWVGSLRGSLATPLLAVVAAGCGSSVPPMHQWQQGRFVECAASAGAGYEGMDGGRGREGDPSSMPVDIVLVNEALAAFTVVDALFALDRAKLCALPGEAKGAARSSIFRGSLPPGQHEIALNVQLKGASAELLRYHFELNSHHDFEVIAGKRLSLEIRLYQRNESLQDVVAGRPVEPVVEQVPYLGFKETLRGLGPPLVDAGSPPLFDVVEGSNDAGAD